MATTTITTDSAVMTLINVFTVDPDHQQELVDLLIEATDTIMQHLDGFVSANIHRSQDGHHVVNYAQWRSRADFDAMLQDARARTHMKRAAEIAQFSPIICDVADTCTA